MLVPIFVVLSNAAAVVSSGVSKLVASRHLRNPGDTSTHVARIGVVTLLGLLLLTAVPTEVFGNAFYQTSLPTVLLGILFGGVVALQGNLSVWAMASGPLSLTSLLTCAIGMMIPALAGTLFWGEPVAALQWVGLLLLIASMGLLMNPKLDRKISWRWCAYTLLASLCSGCVGIMQKVHQSTDYRAERAGLLVVAFASYSLIMVLVATFSRRHYPDVSPWCKGKVAWLGALLGLCTATVHLLNLFLSGALPAVIVFPLLNTVPLLGSTVMGVTIFKEKMQATRLVGFVIGVAALLLIANVF